MREAEFLGGYRAYPLCLEMCEPEKIELCDISLSRIMWYVLLPTMSGEDTKERKKRKMATRGFTVEIDGYDRGNRYTRIIPTALLRVVCVSHWTTVWIRLYSLLCY